MNTNRKHSQLMGPATPSFRKMLASRGVAQALSCPRHEQVIASRRAAESALCIAMVTSQLPGMDVHNLDAELVEPDS